ncbi:TPA: fimbria/pilus outer membrane usher protein, partial [Klebsiella pneumoniae]|nr:fimbria/pilus outer membrane usher protein [Klebsiella pneumoniae]
MFISLLLNQSKAIAIEFNTDMLDENIKRNIDMTRFSQPGYIMPGTYILNMKVNETNVADLELNFYEHPDTENTKALSIVDACITQDQLPLIGLKNELVKKISWWHNGQCADFSALQGINFRADLSDSSLYMTVPQAWLEYSDATWLPPSRWEDGETGIILDYNLTSALTTPNKGNSITNISGNGTTGVNIDAWRLRADYQGVFKHQASQSTQSLDWSRIYAYRALPEIMSKLQLGESYLVSDIFDSWRFTGVSLASDERMLPPKLRGYAPEVSGIAKTNARVIISQMGRILHQTNVAAGPFNIQELSNAVNGRLDVRVEEQDGSVQTFSVDAATVPYLTRPGQIRYKLATGRPSDLGHNMNGSLFTSGEFSWGITNSWSLYGGSILSREYNAFSIGAGRDLLALGAVSADMTQSVADISNKEKFVGKSWRLSYSKHFDEIQSDITFAGYRFSENDYLSMGEFLDVRAGNNSLDRKKELYTLTSSKSFVDSRLSAYLSWNHQTYWNKKATNYYNFSLNKYFDVGNWKDISLGFNATRNQYNDKWNDSFFISMSMPLSNGTLSYSGTYSNNSHTQTTGFYQRLENGDSYRVNGSINSMNSNRFQPQISGFYTHRSDISTITTNATWVENSYSSAGLSFQGGVTATAKGVAMHPGGNIGGTRMMVSTDGVGGVPLNNQIHTNSFGIGVISDVGNYYRTSTRIDVNKLDDDVETSGSSVKESALTEGAIGFRHFAMLKGSKAMAVITSEDGQYPPFGASVLNASGRELGIVGDSGSVWLAGINAKEKLFVNWSGVKQCEITLPDVILTEQSLLLPCKPMSLAS